jgi:transcriptional regulator with XRE-family HTH domain
MADCRTLVFSANALKEQRKKRRLTQKEVADKIGVSERTYQKWEQGESTPNATCFMRLLYVLGLFDYPYALAEGGKG